MANEYKIEPRQDSPERIRYAMAFITMIAVLHMLQQHQIDAQSAAVLLQVVFKEGCRTR